MVAKTEWNMIDCTTHFSQLMRSHRKVSSHLGCWANREGRGKLFTLSPFPAAFSQCLTAHFYMTPLNKKKRNWPVWVYDMKSFEKYLAGKKLLEEKTVSTDWLDSLVNNCSVEDGIQRPHRQLFAEMFDYSDRGEAQSQSFCDKGRKKQIYSQAMTGAEWVVVTLMCVFFGGGAFLVPSVSTASFSPPHSPPWLYSKNQRLPYSEEGPMSTDEILSAMSHSSEGSWEHRRDGPPTLQILLSPKHQHSHGAHTHL